MDISVHVVATHAQLCVRAARDSVERVLGYYALSRALTSSSKYVAAKDLALKRGLELEPRNYELLSDYARHAVGLNRPDALRAAERAVALSPLEAGAYSGMAIVLYYLRRYEEASEYFRQSSRLSGVAFDAWLGTMEIAARRPSLALPYCESSSDIWDTQTCLAIAYYQIGRKPEAAATLERLVTENGDSLAYQYAQIYAQWGKKDTALKWLTTAARLQDPGLTDIKVDPLIDPIRDAPQFEEIVEKLNFPR